MIDKVFAPIGIIVALAVALAMYRFAFTFPQELQTAQILWATGFIYLVLFVVLNFGVERIWFPQPRVGARPVPPLVGAAKRAHIAFGALEGVVFIVAILLIGTGTSLMGTHGYGSF